MGEGSEHKMEMTFIYESSREQHSSCSSHSRRQWRDAGMMRMGASTPTGSEPRPRLEHKIGGGGGLHLPEALGGCDEAWVSWAQLERRGAYIQWLMRLCGWQVHKAKGCCWEGGGLLKVEPEHTPLRFPWGSTKQGLSPDPISAWKHNQRSIFQHFMLLNVHETSLLSDKQAVRDVPVHPHVTLYLNFHTLEKTGAACCCCCWRRQKRI